VELEVVEQEQKIQLQLRLLLEQLTLVVVAAVDNLFQMMLRLGQESKGDQAS
jgi:hypothetical protein